MSKKPLKILYYIVLGCLVAIALFVVASALPIPGNFEIRVVRSGSMEPAIKTGSIVVIQPRENYAIGDIITFEGNFKDANGKKVPTTHRIVEMRVERGDPIYTTKGDANEDSDSNEVRANQLIGKVFLSVPYAGYAVETARTPYGFLAIIVIPAFLVIGDQGVKVYKEIKNIKKKKA